jgi:hypothetical protein
VIELGTRALFSDQLLQNLLDSPADGGRAASEAHHLFPTTWLHSRGIQERRRVNQVANLADVGWHENSVIGNRGPASSDKPSARMEAKRSFRGFSRGSALAICSNRSAQ